MGCRIVVGILCALVMSADVAFAEPSGWRRGINMADYLAYPSSDVWPIFRGPRTTTTEAELKRLADLGVDFIRLPVEPLPFVDRDAGEVHVSEQRLVSFVRRAHAAGLKVMLTGFARPDEYRFGTKAILATGGGETYLRYMAFLKRLVELTRDLRTDMLALEPMNEPQAVCWRTDGGPDWATVQRAMIGELRAYAPRLTLVLTTGCWSRLAALKHIDLADYDNNTLIDIHYYEPWTFTHQSAQWTLNWIKWLASVSFPPSTTDKQAAIDASARLFVARNPTGTPSDFQETLRQLDDYVRADHGPERIGADMKSLAHWARANGISSDRIVIGEFGVYRPRLPAGPPDDGSRARWLDTVRKSAEAEGLGWALWSYHGDFGIVTDDATSEFDRATLSALGLVVR